MAIFKNNLPGCAASGCTCGGVIRPPWSCTSPSSTLTITWYYYTCTPDPSGSGPYLFTVNGPITTTLNDTHGTSIFKFLSAAEALPSDAWASCTPLVGSDTDSGRCRYVRFTAGCTDSTSSNPGASMLVNSLDGGGTSPPSGSGDCDVAGTGSLHVASVSSSPFMVTFDGMSSVRPMFAHGILTA